MKVYKSILLKLMLCPVIAVNLTGCWDRRELDQIAIVTGVAIDKPEETGNVEMTIQITKALKQKESSMSGEGNFSENYINFKNTENTIFNAIRNLSRESSRKLLFSQNKVMMFSREIAEGGLEKYIDFFLRDHETRLLVWVFVTDNHAGDIFNVMSDFESNQSKNVTKLIDEQIYNSQAPRVDLLDFILKLTSKTTSPVAPVIKVSKDGPKKNVQISGTAVFKKDRMAGELDKKESRGMLWVIGGVKKGAVVIPEKKGNVSIEIIRASSKIIPEIKNGKIVMKVKISSEGVLAEQSSSEDLTKIKVFESLEKEEAAAIKSEVMSALKKAYSLSTDIFGFGDAIQQHYPREWKLMEGNWEEIFKKIDVEVTVDARLQRTGRITKPILSKEE